MIEAVYIKSMKTGIKAGYHSWAEDLVAGCASVIAQGGIIGRNVEVVQVEIDDRGIQHEIGRLIQVAESEGKGIRFMIMFGGIPLHTGIATACAGRNTAGIDLSPQGGAGTNQQK